MPFEHCVQSLIKLPLLSTVQCHVIIQTPANKSGYSMIKKGGSATGRKKNEGHDDQSEQPQKPHHSYNHTGCSKSTLPPDMTIPTREFTNRSGLRKIAANPTIPEGSTSSFARDIYSFMASMICASETVMISST